MHKKDKSLPRCDYCHYVGHTVDICRKKNAVTTLKNPTHALPTTKTKSEISCYGCNTPGVFRSNCPKCQQKDKKTPAESIEFYSMNCRIGRDIPTVGITIFGQYGQAHIDTGARTSIAGSTLYKQLKKNGCTFQPNTATVTLADGSSREQTVLTTLVTMQLGDRENKIKFTILPEALDNRTLLGIDFLESAGIILNPAQRIWHYIEYPLMVYPYDTAIGKPNAITDYVELMPRKPQLKAAATNTSPIADTKRRTRYQLNRLKSLNDNVK